MARKRHQKYDDEQAIKYDVEQAVKRDDECMSRLVTGENQLSGLHSNDVYLFYDVIRLTTSKLLLTANVSSKTVGLRCKHTVEVLIQKENQQQ